MTECKNVENLPLRDDCVEVRPRAPDWTLLTKDEPFFEKESNSMRVVVSVGGVPKNQQETEEKTREGFPIAVQSLFDNFDKQDTEENRAQIENNLAPIDIFVPFRPDLGCPDLGTKILYAIDKNVFDGISFNNNPDLPPTQFEVVLDASTLRRELQELAKILRSIQDTDGATIEQATNVNFEKQIRKVETLFGFLESFLTANEITINENPLSLQAPKAEIRGEWFVFGLDANSMPKFFLLDNGEELFRLRCEFGELQRFFTPVLGVFLRNLEQLKRTGNYGESLFQLVSTIPNFELPNVNLDIAGQRLNVFNAKSIVNVETEFGKGLGINFQDKTSTPYSDEDKAEQDKKINDDTWIEQLGQNIEQNITQELARQADERFGFLEDINSLDDAFNLLLNRVDFRCLLAAATECLINNLGGLGVDEDTIRCEMVKGYLRGVSPSTFIEVLQELNVKVDELPTFKNNIEKNLLECWNSLDKQNKKDLNAGMKLKVGLSINDSTAKRDIQANEKEKLIEGFGFRSKNILTTSYVRNSTQIINELIDKVGCSAFAFLSNSSFSGLSFANSAFDALRKLDICDLEFFLNLPFPFLTFTFNFDDLFPTWDELAAFIEALVSGILSALTSAILDFIKNLLTLSLSVCEGDGVVGIGNSFADGTALKNALASGLGVFPSQLTANNIGSLVLDRLNLEPEFTLNLPFENFANALSQFLGDLGAVLTPNELIMLLSGETTEEMRELLRCVINGRYPSLSGIDLGSLGRGLGGLVDKNQLLRQARTITEETQEKCEPGLASVRQNILEDKGLSPELIEKQLMNARARKLQQLSALAQQIEDPNFQDIVPNIFCGENGAGLTTQNPRSVQFQLGRTLNAIFDGIKSNFNRDIQSFVPAISELANERKRVKKFKKGQVDGEEFYYVNPEWNKLVAQGFPDDIYEEGETTIDEDATNDPEREAIVFEPIEKNAVAQGLLKSFRNVSSTFTSLNNGFKINVPTLVDDVSTFTFQALQNTNFSQFSSFLGGNFGEITEDTFNSLQNTEIIERLTPRRYGIEFVFQNSCEARDVYEFGYYFTTTENGEKTYIHRSTENNDAPLKAKNFINNKQLTNNRNDKPPQETFFIDYLSKEISQGLGINETQTIEQTLERNFANEEFYSLFEKTLQLVSLRTSQSKLFNRSILSAVDFTPPPIPGCDPSLLGVQDAKDKAKQAVMNNECSTEDFPNTNPYSPKLSSMERTALRDVVAMLYRLYVIETFLKGIFMISEFNISNDEVMKSYLRSEAKRDIKEFGEVYFDDIMTETLKLYNESVEPERRSTNVDDAINWFIEINFEDVRKKLSIMVDAPNRGLNLNRTMLETAFPLYDVWEKSNKVENDFEEHLRFYNKTTQTNEKEIKTLTEVESLLGQEEILFTPDDGGFVLERYARIKFTPAFLSVETPPNDIQNEGVVSFSRLGQFIRSFSGRYTTEQMFSAIKVGLRVVYVLPIESFQIAFNLSQDFSKLGQIANENPQLAKSLRNREKAFFLTEGYRKDNNLLVRKFNSIPLVFAEDFVDVIEDNVNVPGTAYLNQFEARKNSLINKMLEQSSFSFMFDYIVPLKRAVVLTSLMSSAYFSSKREVDVLFEPTKSSIKRTFYSLKNAGVSDYQDPIVERGNVALTESENPFDVDEPDIGAIIIKFILETPLRILKGLVEITDPNIRNAKIIADTSRIFCKPISIQVASLAQLPINVFGPPPLGIGIGPPITPLGFVYLAHEAYESVPFPECDEAKTQQAQNAGKNLLQGDGLSRRICEELTGRRNS